MQRQPFIGAKKFVVAPPKPAIVDDAKAHELLSRVIAAVNEIHNSNSSLLSFEELYRYSYNLVLYKQGHLLYEGVSNAIRERLEKERDRVRSSPDGTLLAVLRAVWVRHCVNMRMLRDILLYMDRTYVAQHRKLLVYDNGTLLFRDHLLRHADVRGRVQGLLLAVVRDARAATAPTTTAAAGVGVDAAGGSSAAGGAATPSLMFAADTGSVAAGAAAAAGAASASASSSSSSSSAALGGSVDASAAAGGGGDLCAVDASLMRGSLHMLVELGINSMAVYTDEFEAPMLAEAAQHYHDESREVLARCTVAEYLAYAERRLEEERARCVEVMHHSTLPTLLHTVEDKLVADHATALATAEGSGLAVMLQHDRYADIRRMFRLFSRVKSTVPWRTPDELVQSERDRDRLATPVAVLKDVVKARIIAEGRRLVFDAAAQKEPFSLIQGLLNLRDKYAAVVTHAFGDDRIFAGALKEGLENVVNAQEPGRHPAAGPNCVAAYLAAYVDECMTREFKTLPEPAIMMTLDKVIAVFRALAAKDVFEEHYKDRTAKRLLAGRVSSEDVERVMVAKLKQECGSTYTGKLEGMFADISKSAAAMEAWRSEGRPAALAAAARSASSAGAASSSPSSGPSLASVGAASSIPDIDATVLTSSHWESRSLTLSPVPRGMPDPVLAIADAYKAYYLGKHTGRKLVWNCSKGTAEVRARFGTSTGTAGGGGGAVYELTVSTYQMVLLHAFNNVAAVHAALIASGLPVPSVEGGIPYKYFASLGIPDDECRRHLLSLLNPKVKILNKVTPAASPAAAGSAAPAGAAASSSSSSAKEVTDADVFTVNDAFASKLMRIRVPLISMKSAMAAAQAAAGAATGGAAASGGSGAASGGTGGDDAELLASVEEGRKLLLESVIVRVMKARRHMEHNALVAEVTRMVSTRFLPQPVDIKKRVEALIERDYLERGADNMAMYSYVA